MAKDKKSSKSDKPAEAASDAPDNYEKRLPALLPFAAPLAPKKLNKRILKTVKKGEYLHGLITRY